MTPLRQKMIKAMELRNLAKNTQHYYLSAVIGLARYYQQSPETISQEMIGDYLLYLKKVKGNALTTVGSVISGLRFFYNHVVGDEQLSPCCTFAKTPCKLPTVLSQQEIWSIINATNNLKHRVLLMTIYSAGLRASEVLILKHEHIDSKRMLIKVTGKGGKQRYSLLSKRLLPELRRYYKTYLPTILLFPSHRKAKPLAYETVRAVYEKARKKAGVKRRAGVYTLRHSFAINTLRGIIERKESAQEALPVLAAYLGHKKYHYSTVYLKVADAQSRNDLVHFTIWQEWKNT